MSTLLRSGLLLGLALGALCAATSAQGRNPLDRSPREIQALMREHMVRRPYTAIERSLVLTGRELDQVRELLEMHASTTFQRHLAAEREGRPGVAAVIKQQIEAEEKRRLASDMDMEAPEDDGLEGFDYLPITVIDDLVHLLPPARSREFLDDLGSAKRMQLNRLGKRRVLAFKKAGPKMLAELSRLRASGAFKKSEGYQSYGSAPERSTSLFGGRGRRGGRGRNAGAGGLGGGFGGGFGGSTGARGAGGRGGSF